MSKKRELSDLEICLVKLLNWACENAVDPKKVYECTDCGFVDISGIFTDGCMCGSTSWLPVLER